MKSYIIFAILICLITCQKTNKCPSDDSLAKCSEEKSPVCGIKYVDSKQVKETYQNECIACQYGKVQFTIDGSCNDFPNDAQFCDPYTIKSLFCMLIYEPFCGYYYKQFNTMKPIDEPNSCIACKNSQILYLIKGFCPK